MIQWHTAPLGIILLWKIKGVNLECPKLGGIPGHAEQREHWSHYRGPQFPRIPMELSLQSLKSTLWDAANILRGSAVDRTDWKGYILPLLFFKRISDVWDEETAF